MLCLHLYTTWVLLAIWLVENQALLEFRHAWITSQCERFFISKNFMKNESNIFPCFCAVMHRRRHNMWRTRLRFVPYQWSLHAITSSETVRMRGELYCMPQILFWVGPVEFCSHSLNLILQHSIMSKRLVDIRVYVFLRVSLTAAKKLSEIKAVFRVLTVRSVAIKLWESFCTTVHNTCPKKCRNCCIWNWKFLMGFKIVWLVCLSRILLSGMWYRVGPTNMEKG